MTRFLTRTALTKDEAIAYLLRIIDGPVEFWPTDPESSEDADAEVVSAVFSIQEVLNDQLDDAEEAYHLAMADKRSAEEITLLQVQVDRAKRYIELANDISCALNDELIQPEQLRIDPDWGSPELPYISLASLRRWANESEVIAAVRRELDVIAANGSASIAPAKAQKEPWWQHFKDDPEPKEKWYTPARYFLRQYLKDNPEHRKLSMDKLAEKVAPFLAERNIFKRGDIEPLAASTIRKAFSRVKY